MNATQNRKRLFPSYTLAQLKGWANLDAEKAAKVAEEIAARESGASKISVTPQILGGMVRPVIGRM